MSQMYQTEICECGKLKQFGKACKTCGITNMQSYTIADAVNELKATDGAFYRPDRIPVAKAMPVEDDIERARR